MTLSPSTATHGPEKLSIETFFIHTLLPLIWIALMDVSEFCPAGVSVVLSIMLILLETSGIVTGKQIGRAHV